MGWGGGGGVFLTFLELAKNICTVGAGVKQLAQGIPTHTRNIAGKPPAKRHCSIEDKRSDGK